MRIDPDTCRDPDLLASEVRRLRTVIAAGFPAPENAAQPESLTDAERWAVSVAMGIINEGNYGWPDGTTPPQDTLRGLLDRHGGGK